MCNSYPSLYTHIRVFVFRVRVSCSCFRLQHSRALASPLLAPHWTLRLSRRGLRALLDCDSHKTALFQDGSVLGRLRPRTAPAATKGRAPGMLLTPLPVGLGETSKKETDTNQTPTVVPCYKTEPIVDRFAETVTTSVAHHCYAIPFGSGRRACILAGGCSNKCFDQPLVADPSVVHRAFQIHALVLVVVIEESQVSSINSLSLR